MPYFEAEGAGHWVLPAPAIPQNFASLNKTLITQNYPICGQHILIYTLLAYLMPSLSGRNSLLAFYFFPSNLHKFRKASFKNFMLIY